MTVRHKKHKFFSGIVIGETGNGRVIVDYGGPKTVKMLPENLIVIEKIERPYKLGETEILK